MTYEQIVKLENALRTHIAEQKERLEAAMKSDNVYIYITYDHEKKDGKWRVRSHYKPEFDVEAAMLSVAVDEAITRIARVDRLDVLPRLLTSVVTGDGATAIIEDESDE